ncbi:MAG: ACP S-malonyltransferase [Spirochaetaceae bacterium]|jgi:[acyl-carrier-protein] S-malonyltransferase|nr:ACP S-malonyltransferase [Spirochaetaceae bacterium]
MITASTKTVFLFPGQGAQYRGMGLDLLEKGGAAVKGLFALASEIMGRDMAALLAGADDVSLKRSDTSQPAVTLVNLAAAAFLGERGIKPAACAGFSLGEYAALVTAGIVTAEDCFCLVKLRGRAMQASSDRIAREAAPAGGADSADSADNAPGMAAVIGLPPGRVEELVAGWREAGLEGLYGANFNSPKQVVVSGTAAALAEAQARFKEAGAKRVLRLQVAGPFHSPLIADAAEAFAPALEKTAFRDPLIPCFSNVTGKRVSSGEEAKGLALKQIVCPIYWTREEASVAAEGIGAALETGPGKVLQGLWRDSGSAVPCYPAGTAADIEALFGAGTKPEAPQEAAG